MLSEKIYQLRRKNGLSQEQLAEKIGVSRQAISKWESGASTPGLDKLRALSECFQVTMDELTGGQEADTLPDGAEQEPVQAGPKGTESRVGLCLCAMGAVGLILLGILMVVRPAAAEQVDASSTITLNGTGILMALFVLSMAVGVVMTLKKK